jgi:uncharacterized protein YegL
MVREVKADPRRSQNFCPTILYRITGGYGSKIINRGREGESSDLQKCDVLNNQPFLGVGRRLTGLPCEDAGVMNKNFTEIAFILDRSGSMARVTEAAITGFNEFLRDQQKVEGQARLTLVLFDNEYLVPMDSIPVQEAVALDATTYVPRGSTSLLDAIGTTVDNLGARISAMPESNRPGQVIVAILTDGYENSSVKFTWQDISHKILEQTNTYKWQFLFLGANQDAIATAASLNIAAVNASSYVGDTGGTYSGQKAVSRKMAAMRKMSAGAPMSSKERRDSAAPLSEIVAEEDAEGRKGKK